jgi:hypothetical protein
MFRIIRIKGISNLYCRLTLHRKDFSEMALPIETMTMEQKQLERATAATNAAIQCKLQTRIRASNILPF